MSRATTYAKAIAVGIATGLLAPLAVVIGLVVIGFGFAGTGGGGIAGLSLAVPVALLVVVGGFLGGFVWALRRERAKAQKSS